MLVFLKMTRESEVELWPRSSESFIVTDVGAKLLSVKILQLK